MKCQARQQAKSTRVRITKPAWKNLAALPQTLRSQLLTITSIFSSECLRCQSVLFLIASFSHSRTGQTFWMPWAQAWDAECHRLKPEAIGSAGSWRWSARDSLGFTGFRLRLIWGKAGNAHQLLTIISCNIHRDTSAPLSFWESVHHSARAHTHTQTGIEKTTHQPYKHRAHSHGSLPRQLYLRRLQILLCNLIRHNTIFANVWKIPFFPDLKVCNLYIHISIVDPCDDKTWEPGGVYIPCCNLPYQARQQAKSTRICITKPAWKNLW